MLLQINYQRFFLLILKLYLTFLHINPFISDGYSELLLLRNEKVCQSIDIRKNSQLINLVNCTVIEGDLNFFLVTVSSDKRFPLLKEITGSLVIYFMNGIQTLQLYFPNLAVIRGQTLCYNYALVIKDTNLLYIGLTNLRLISFGGIRIDNNPSLCYISSINWASIVKQPGAPKKTINIRNNCPDFCPKNCSQNSNILKSLQSYCWSYKTCQMICSLKCIVSDLYCYMDDVSRCCHNECLGGCYGDGDDKCVTCRNVMSNGRCVKTCDIGYYKYKNRRCISMIECLKLVSQSSSKDLYAIDDDSCVEQCSTGKELDAISRHCVICGLNCSKKFCGKFLIHSINDLKEVEGCYSIEEIYINIKEGGSSLSDILEKSFSKLTVIENSLKIYRSSSITSLNFLKSLKRIKGTSVRNNKVVSETFERSNENIVFEILDNENLVDIFDDKLSNEHSNITIEYGTVFFNLNRKLCPEKIFSFLRSNVQSSMKLSSLQVKVINISNGDMAFCKHKRLIVTIKSISDTSFVVECKSKILDSILQDSGSAALFMLKETQKNVSQYELFNSCSDQNWRTIEGSLGKRVTIDGLKPATKYAFYVEAIRSRVDNWLEISDVIYLTTKRKHPSPPVNLKLETLSHSEIRLTWSPPLFPNGIVTKYNIWYRNIDISHEEFLNVDFCAHKTYFQTHRSRQEIKTEVKENSQGHSNPLICDCNSCMTKCNENIIKRDIDQEIFDFQLLDHYISQSFQKQDNIPKSNWSPKASDEFDIKNANNNSNNDSKEYSETTTQSTPKEEDSQIWSLLNNSSNRSLKMVSLSADHNDFIFPNLHHYTEYLFEIEACQDPLEEMSTIKYKNDYNSADSRKILKNICSLRQSVSGHTFPKNHMDNIDKTTIFTNVTGNKVEIHWVEPDTPNGLILNFWLRYREVLQDKADNWLEELCIKRSEWLNDQDSLLNKSRYSNISSLLNYKSQLEHSQIGYFTIHNLRPGNYEFQIKSISIPANGSWTNAFYFIIPQNSIFNIYRPYFIAGSIISVIILFITIWFIYFYHRKRYLAKTKWVSSNPDYWIIYEIDEWEIDRKEIDMIEWNYPLGRGSFGMVYKGTLKNLTTPAKLSYCNDAGIKDMFVAVKTLNANSTILERREFINEACYMKQFQSYHLVQLLGIVSKINHSGPNNRRFSNNLFCSRQNFVERLRNWNLLSKANIFRSNKSKIIDPPGAQLDIDSSQMISFKITISQHFQKMPLVIMELMEYGDLAGYLRKQGEEGEGFISESQSYLWALQIADGMLYLSDMKFVHRDLAARNCMINKNLTIKIGDFGMARDIYYDCYYKKEGKGRLPVRWMAPESLQSAYFTTNSDVWSYGIVLWEIFTLASLPYRGMSHHDVIQFVTNKGTLLSNPMFNCPKILLNVVENCWKYNPDSRPTFQYICTMLELHADQNFQINSYYFQQRFLDHQNQDLDVLESQLDRNYSSDNFIGNY